MKKKSKELFYETPTVEVIVIHRKDVITTSTADTGTENWGDDMPQSGWT